MRPSQEQWQARQSLLSRLEQSDGSFKISEGNQNPAVNAGDVQKVSQSIFQLSEELDGYAGDWDREGAIKSLQESSEQYASTDLTEDPQAPIKALVADTARMTASISSVGEEQAARFVKNFMDQSAGVFADPRAGEAFSNGRAPQAMIAESAQKLVAGLDDVSANMLGKKASATLKQTTEFNAKANRPRSALELSQNRSFDVERKQKLDPFSHLRGKEVAFEQNDNSGIKTGPK